MVLMEIGMKKIWNWKRIKKSVNLGVKEKEERKKEMKSRLGKSPTTNLLSLLMIEFQGG